MPFVTRALAACRHVASRLSRAATIVAMVCLAIPLMLFGWCFWLTVYAFCAFMLIVSGPPRLFRYEEQHENHEHA